MIQFIKSILQIFRKTRRSTAKKEQCLVYDLAPFSFVVDWYHEGPKGVTESEPSPFTHYYRSIPSKKRSETLEMRVRDRLLKKGCLTEEYINEIQNYRGNRCPDCFPGGAGDHFLDPGGHDKR